LWVTFVTFVGSDHDKYLILKELLAYFGLKKGPYRPFWGQKERYGKKAYVLNTDVATKKAVVQASRKS